MNALVSSSGLSQLSYARCRLYRDNISALRCKGTGIATAACADIQSQACLLVQLGQPVTMDLLKGHGLVLSEEGLGIAAVLLFTPCLIRYLLPSH